MYQQKLVTVKELSEITSVPATTLRKWRRLGIIRGYCPGGRTYLFDPEEVVKQIKRG